MKRGQGACKTPRLNARRFEELVVGKVRSNADMTDAGASPTFHPAPRK